MDRRERARFLFSERQAVPWRERLVAALAPFEVVAPLRTPPQADARIERIVRRWELVRDSGPVRFAFGTVGQAAEHVAGRIGEAAGETWILPGPSPQVGLLEFATSPGADVIATLITWNGDGCIVFIPELNEVLVIDLLDQRDGPAVEIQSATNG